MRRRSSNVIHVPTECATMKYGFSSSLLAMTGNRAAAISGADRMKVSFLLFARPGYSTASKVPCDHSTRIYVIYILEKVVFRMALQTFLLRQRSSNGLSARRGPIPSLVYISSAFPAFGKAMMWNEGL